MYLAILLLLLFSKNVISVNYLWEYEIHEDISIDGDQELGNKKTATICSCKDLCETMPACNSFSTVRASDWVHCSLRSEFCHISSTKTSTGSLYFCKPGKYIRGTDGRKYYRSGEKLSIDDALSFCEKIEGFQMAMLKNIEQYNAAQKIYDDENIGAMWIGMKDLDTGKSIWNDGTPYSDTNMNASYIEEDYEEQIYYRFHNGLLRDTPSNQQHVVLCVQTQT